MQHLAWQPVVVIGNCSFLTKPKVPLPTPTSMVTFLLEPLPPLLMPVSAGGCPNLTIATPTSVSTGLALVISKMGIMPLSKGAYPIKPYSTSMLVSKESTPVDPK
jgi:hypothetical protein